MQVIISSFYSSLLLLSPLSNFVLPEQEIREMFYYLVGILLSVMHTQSKAWSCFHLTSCSKSQCNGILELHSTNILTIYKSGLNWPVPWLFEVLEGQNFHCTDFLTDCQKVFDKLCPCRPHANLFHTNDSINMLTIKRS